MNKVNKNYFQLSFRQLYGSCKNTFSIEPNNNSTAFITTRLAMEDNNSTAVVTTPLAVVYCTGFCAVAMAISIVLVVIIQSVGIFLLQRINCPTIFMRNQNLLLTTISVSYIIVSFMWLATLIDLTIKYNRIFQGTFYYISFMQITLMHLLTLDRFCLCYYKLKYEEYFQVKYLKRLIIVIALLYGPVCSLIFFKDPYDIIKMYYFTCLTLDGIYLLEVLLVYSYIYVSMRRSSDRCHIKSTVKTHRVAACVSISVLLFYITPKIAVLYFIFSNHGGRVAYNLALVCGFGSLVVPIIYILDMKQVQAKLKALKFKVCSFKLKSKRKIFDISL